MPMARTKNVKGGTRRKTAAPNSPEQQTLTQMPKMSANERKMIANAEKAQIAGTKVRTEQV